MKYTRSFVNGLVACGLAAAMLTALCAQAKDGEATVIRIKGSARYSLGNNVWQPLKVGDRLAAGTVVQTDRENSSFVDLALTEGASTVREASTVSFAPPKGGPVRYQPATAQNIVRLMENTVLGIDKLSTTETGADTVSDTQLDLKAGRIVGSVKKMNAASRYEIKLPNGVAGIRGTIYDITADGIVRVASGSVVVSFVDPQGNVQTRVVSGGQEYNSRTDQITPLGASDIERIQDVSRGFGISMPGSSTPAVRDMTIIFVSPTTGETTTGSGGGEFPTEN